MNSLECDRSHLDSVHKKHTHIQLEDGRLFGLIASGDLSDKPAAYPPDPPKPTEQAAFDFNKYNGIPRSKFR